MELMEKREKLPDVMKPSESVLTGIDLHCLPDIVLNALSMH